MNRPISDERTMEAQRREQGDGSKPVGDGASQEAREAAGDATEAGKERLEAGSERAAQGVGDFADAVGSAASRLSQLEHEGLADYANRMASYLSDISDRLRAKSVDEVADDVRRLADRNPAMFLLGSVALGLGLSRFAKASRDRRSLDGVGEGAEWRGAGQSAAYRVGGERTALDGQMSPDETGGGGGL